MEEKQGIYLTPFQRQLLLKNLKSELRAEYRRRIEIMLLADSGQSQAQICMALGCAQETARYWMTVAQAGQAHNWRDRTKGRPKTVNEEYRHRLQELVSHSPRDYGYSFQRWTAQWLSKHLAKELGVEVSDRYVNMLLKEMGLSTRQKPKSAVETSQQQDSNINISDLQSDFAPEPLWTLDLIQVSN